jgi:hypothetical protein
MIIGMGERAKTAQDLVGRRVVEVETCDGARGEPAEHGLKLVFDDGAVLEVEATEFFGQGLLQVSVKHERAEESA